MTANGDKTVFTVTDSTKRFWDPDSTTTIYYNDIANTAYQSIHYPSGVVTWASTPGNSAVTASGKYLAVVQVGQAKGWTLDAQYSYVDTTIFGDTFQVQTPILLSGTVTLDTFYADATLFTEMTSSAARVGFDLFVDATGASEKRYAGYGTIASVGVQTDVAGVIVQPLTLNISDGPYYVAGL